MRSVRRLIGIVTGCAAWCIAAATVASARPDPGGGVIIRTPADTAAAAGTPLWQIFAMAALGLLLVIAVAVPDVGAIQRVARLNHTSEWGPRGPHCGCPGTGRLPLTVSPLTVNPRPIITSTQTHFAQRPGLSSKRSDQNTVYPP